MTNATSATGSDISVLAMVVKMSRRLPCSRSREVGAEQHGDENRRADDRHRQQDLKRRLRDELNGDRLPVRRRQQRAALEQVLQVQIDFTIAPVYPVTDLVAHPAHRARRRRGRARRRSGRLGFERARFGASDEAALRRVEAELRAAVRRQRRHARGDGRAGRRGSGGSRATGRAIRPRCGRLFDARPPVVPADDAGRDRHHALRQRRRNRLAWAGRVSDLPKERVLGPATLADRAGRARPAADSRRAGLIERTASARATVVAEQALGDGAGRAGLSDTFVLPTSIVPVTLRARPAIAGGAAGRRSRFVSPRARRRLRARGHGRAGRSRRRRARAGGHGHARGRAGRASR